MDIRDITVEKLQLYVPFGSMSESHVEQLIKHCRVDVLCAGQSLFPIVNRQKCRVYLLSGAVTIIVEGGDRKSVSAGSEECAFALEIWKDDVSDVVANSDSTFMILDADYIEKILCWDQVAKYLAVDMSYNRDLDEDAEWMLTILKSNLFYKIPPLNIESIFNKMTPIVVHSGEVVLRQGEIGDGCYFIKEGEAEVLRVVEGDSKPTQLAVWRDGSCFGEDALINHTVRNATVKMLTNGVLMFLAKKDFIALLKESPAELLPVSDVLDAQNNGALCIDVRTKEEFDLSHVKSAIHMPLDLLRLQQRSLDQSKDYIIYSDQSARSSAASTLLAKKGFNTKVLKGGINQLELIQPDILVTR